MLTLLVTTSASYPHLPIHTTMPQSSSASLSALAPLLLLTCAPNTHAIPVKRQVNPAAFSGVTDEISSAGQAAGDKAVSATSGLTRTQLGLVVAFCIIGVVAIVAGTFWLCSCSRRRKRAREEAERADSLHSSSSNKELHHGLPDQQHQQRQSLLPSSRSHRHSGPSMNEGWGESRLALNSSFLHSSHDAYGRNERQSQYAAPASYMQAPRQPQQSFPY